MKKFLITSLSCIMLAPSFSFFSSGDYANASVVEGQNKYSEEYFQKNARTYEKYINYDANSMNYSVSKNAKNDLETEEYNALVNHIDSMNNMIKETWNNANENEQKEIDVINPNEQSDSDFVTEANYKEGVTKVTFHWWGAKIYIKKSHLRNAGNGLTVGGIWLPHKVLSKVTATGGVILSSAPGGIIINRTYVGGFKWASFQ